MSSIVELPVADWDGLCGDRPNARHGWLRTVAECAHAPPDFRFFVAREGGRLVGAAACYLARHPKSRYLNDRGLGRMARGVPAMDLLPALVCGVGAAHGGAGLLVSRTLPAERRERIGRGLIETLESYAREHRLTLIFNDMLESEDWLPMLRERGYARTMVAPSVVLPIAWPDFDGYLVYLKSRSRSAYNNARREINRCRSSGTTIVLTPITDEYAAASYDLLQAHHRYKNNERFPFDDRFLDAARRYCGQDAALMVALKDSRVVAAAFILRQDRTLWLVYLGMNRALCSEHLVYFDMSFYTPVRHAIGLRLREIVLGPGVYQAKLSRGCRLVRRYMLVKRRRSASQAVTRRWLRWHERWHMHKHAGLYARDREYVAREAAGRAPA